jgi:hypothetical protein
MKAIRSLSAIMLTGAVSGALLVTMEGGAAVAKSRHHFLGDVPHEFKSFDPVQRSTGASDAAVLNNANTAHTNGNLNAGADGKGGHDSRGLPDDGPMKKGDNLPGKVAPQNSGTVDSGKNQIGDREDAVRHDVGHPDAAIDAGKSEPVIADGPGHKTKKTTDTPKKITTIFRPHLIKDHEDRSGRGNIERNAVGLAIHNDGGAKPGWDSKPGSKGVHAPAGAPVSTASNAIANTTKSTVEHARNIAVENPRGPTIDGTSFGRPGSNLTSIGGSTKNIAGTLSGNSFKPKYP